MDRFHIIGGRPVSGEIYVSGAKNSALKLMAAAILTKSEVVLKNVPNLADINSMRALLLSMGCEVDFDIKDAREGSSMRINCGGMNKLFAAYDFVRKMRASVVVLGPMLARFGEAKVSLPGGCAIGARPVDMHLSALTQMGAEISIDEGYIVASAKEGLKGADIFFEKVSVGATENIMMAATLADGVTKIHNAAKEPEIVDLANMLCKCGAKISGAGSDIIVIEGRSEINGGEHTVIPDRLEAGTFAVLAVATDGELCIKNCDPAHLEEPIYHLRKGGAEVEIFGDYITVKRGKHGLSCIDIRTAPYPGFPTDLQAQYAALASISNGVSHITETIFENRFMHASELMRMGANVHINDNTMIVTGVSRLGGAEVMASDLRGSVSLVIAGLAASGATTINRIYHLDRGYERLEDKLRACGALIERKAG